MLLHARQVLGVGLAPGPVLLEHQPPAEPRRARSAGTAAERPGRARSCNRTRAPAIARSARRSIRSLYAGSCAAMTSASSVRNHSESTPVVHELVFLVVHAVGDRRPGWRAHLGDARGTPSSRSSGRRARRRPPAAGRGRRRPASAPARSGGPPSGSRRGVRPYLSLSACAAASRRRAPGSDRAPRSG